MYMIFCECQLKKHRGVHWDDVTIIEEDRGSTDELVFTRYSFILDVKNNKFWS